MSETESSSFTIRLTPDDKIALDELCTHYGLNRPDSLRRAMRQVINRSSTLTAGYFVPANHRLSAFPIRLAREAVHD